uniref:Rap1 GTPase-activating protein 1 n=1 Tax=Culex pipiens TaxID=7175 RepID=A0A8D8C0U9_CULPI
MPSLPFNDSGGEAEAAAVDRILEELIETIETTTTTTTTTFEMFQVPEPPTPRRCMELGGQLAREPFRWTGLALEREDDLISAVPDAVSIASSTEEPTTEDGLVTITVGDSSDDMDVDSEPETKASVELVKTNLEVAPRQELEVVTTTTTCRLNSSAWIEGCNDEPPEQITWQINDIELNTADYYRNFFIVWNHFNLVGHDRHLGPVLLSFTAEETISQEKHFRVLLWLSTGTLHKVIPVASVGSNPSPIKLAKLLYNRLEVDRFKPVISPDASSMIASFEKDIQAGNHLFSVLRNRSTPALTEFLEFLGQLVQLRDRTLVFTVFDDKDIEFRVTSCDDPTQPMVAIHFQDHPEPNPMHALIVIQPVAPNTRHCRYRVQVGDDESKIFAKSPELREYILTKLINADVACKAEEVRGPLLRKLVRQLERQTREFLGDYGEDREVGQKTEVARPPALEVNTWKYAQLQSYLDDYRKLMRWAQWMKVQIGKREHGDEEYQERIAEKFSALEQFGAELLRVNSQVSLEIQQQIEPVQSLVSQCKRDLMGQICGPPVPAPVAAPVPMQVVQREKKEEKDDGSLSGEALVYQRLVAGIEDEGEWINQKERWLKELTVEDSVSCLAEKHDEFRKEFVSHWDNFQAMSAEGQKLSDGRFSEAIRYLCTLLRPWFDQLQKSATQSLVHALTTDLGNSSVASAADSGFLSATDSSLASPDSPLRILSSLAKSIRVDRKNLWTTCVGMRRAWLYNKFLYISEGTLAQIIEIVGFFLDYVASLLRKDSPEEDLEKITKKLVLKHITGPLFRFFREDRPRGDRDLDTLIKKRALKQRFMQTFSRKTKIANEAANLLHLLALDFVMYFRNNTRKLLDGSYVTQFEHIDRALRGIGFGFLIRPDESV